MVKPAQFNGGGKLEILELDQVSAGDLAAISGLLSQLSPRLANLTIAEEILQEIIDSDAHVQLVARLDGQIAGIATLTKVLALNERYAYLEKFVVDSAARGSGIADQLWDAMVDWAKANALEWIEFTSKPSRVAAHKFYARQGAQIRATSALRYVLPA
jgi:GNAT superfamily N-acetyltransferase